MFLTAVERESLLIKDSIPLEDNSVDAIISSCFLHWVNDLPGTFEVLFSHDA